MELVDVLLEARSFIDTEEKWVKGTDFCPLPARKRPADRQGIVPEVGAPGWRPADYKMCARGAVYAALVNNGYDFQAIGSRPMSEEGKLATAALSALGATAMEVFPYWYETSDIVNLNDLRDYETRVGAITLFVTTTHSDVLHVFDKTIERLKNGGA